MASAALRSLFYSFDDEGHPLQFDFRPDATVILASVAVSLLAVIAFGLMPALKSSRIGVAESLKRQTSTAASSSKFGHWLVAAQAAIAVALIAMAGLLVTGAQKPIAGIDFESSHIALMRLRPNLLKYPPQKAQQFQYTVIQHLEALPDVESVSVVGTGVALSGFSAAVSLPGWLNDRDHSGVECGYIVIGSRYFETLKTPMVHGREFDDRDMLNSPRVAVVNETLARRLWRDGSAIGSSIVVEQQRYQVVGIAKDVPFQSRTAPPEPYVFTAYWQDPEEIDAR